MKKIMICCLVAFASIGLFAQNDAHKGQPPFTPQQFEQMVEESLTKAAGLTPAEAKVFFPLYNEMRKEQREMGIKIYELKKNTKCDAKSCAASILKIKQLQVEMAEVEQVFYKQIIKKVPADKVFKVIKAEDDFHRRMVQGQRNNGRQRHARRSSDQ